jgi:hypothetical protein
MVSCRRHGADHLSQGQRPLLSYTPDVSRPGQPTQDDDAPQEAPFVGAAEASGQLQRLAVGQAAEGAPQDSRPQKYTSSNHIPGHIWAMPLQEIQGWRMKLFDIRLHSLTMHKQRWDDLWLWIDNIWTPRRLPYAKKDGTVHHEWRCRYHKKIPIPSASTGKRKREIRKYYGCPARMTADMLPASQDFAVSGLGEHNHTLKDLDDTKISNGVRKWTSMHVQMDLQPREIQALLSAKDGQVGGSSNREALDAAGGQLLDERTIRNVARKWRWPAAKFNMRQDDLFKDLHTRYNTFPFSIQDMSAFHRDVCDVAREADSVEVFHRLLGERRALRLRQLDRGLYVYPGILSSPLVPVLWECLFLPDILNRRSWGPCPY